MGFSNHFFSIIIPLFNKEDYIKRAILSIRAQTVSNYEVIIVNDGSTDSSASIARKYIDARFIIIDQDNKGVSAARNTGIKQANGDYVAFLDADDTWGHNFLETIIKLMEDFPNAALFATGYNILNADDKYICSKQTPRHNTNITSALLTNYFELAAKDYAPISSSNVCISKKTIIDVGLFPTNIKYGEDMAVWSQIALRYSMATTTNICANYYQFGTANSTQEKFGHIEDHFDFSSLLTTTAPLESKNNESLFKFVEIHTLRQVALAIRNNETEAAKRILLRIKPHFFKLRHYVLQKMIQFPLLSVTVMKTFITINKLFR